MIEQEKIPAVAVEQMNRVHEEEARRINVLLESLDTGADFATVSEHLETVLAHMREHFGTEEALMKQNDFPMYRLHKGEHDKILQEARRTEMEWRNRRDTEALREYFEEQVGDWLHRHILAMDTPLADYLAGRGEV